MRHFLLFVTEQENTENLGVRGKNPLSRLNKFVFLIVGSPRNLHMLISPLYLRI